MSLNVNIRMKTIGIVPVLLAVCAAGAQTAEPNINTEVQAVRAEVSRSLTALRQYTWTEHTQVSAKGDTKAETAWTCTYNADGELVRRSARPQTPEAEANGISKRPMVRKKSDQQDYIERALSMIRQYVPPKPELVDAALEHGNAAFRRAADGTNQIELKNYYRTGDSYVFTYDPSNKALLRANVSSNLGNVKDPMTLEASFETLPNGVNHLASATLKAPAKKVQVKVTNGGYQKSS